METLSLAPIPSLKSIDASASSGLYEEGFVDEMIVLSVIARGPYERIYVQPEDMVLSSSEDDYAGWALPMDSPFRTLLATQAPTPLLEARLPTPPKVKEEEALSEDGISEPHLGARRWWLVGACGAMTCGIFALTLLSLVKTTGLSGEMERTAEAPQKVTTYEIVQMPKAAPLVVLSEVQK